MMTTSTASSNADDWPAWVSAPARLTGRQEPAEESWFDGHESLGDQAAQLAARVGVPAFPWQYVSLRKILSRRPDGLWVHPDAVILTLCAVVGTKVITKRLAVSLLMRVATGQTRCATSGVPFSRAALSNKDVWRLLLRATLIVAAILLLAFGGAPR